VETFDDTSFWAVLSALFIVCLIALLGGLTSVDVALSAAWIVAGISGAVLATFGLCAAWAWLKARRNGRR
jgi:hypothetical protein